MLRLKFKIQFYFTNIWFLCLFYAMCISVHKDLEMNETEFVGSTIQFNGKYKEINYISTG